MATVPKLKIRRNEAPYFIVKFIPLCGYSIQLKIRFNLLPETYNHVTSHHTILWKIDQSINWSIFHNLRTLISRQMIFLRKKYLVPIRTNVDLLNAIKLVTSCQSDYNAEKRKRFVYHIWPFQKKM